MFRRNRMILLILVLVLETTPFLLAAGYWRNDWVFGGFLANPVDGATYVAKMQEGWAGGWLFSQNYSAQPPRGAPIYLFYIFLGHLARITGVPLLVVFHGARILTALGLLAALASFCDRCFPGNPRGADQALWLAAIGSGMGWVGMLFSGEPGADLWVTEGYPFLTMFVNPHFPLGLALVLAILNLDQGKMDLRRGLLLAVMGLLLAIVQPFGLVIAGVGLGMRTGWTWWVEKRVYPFALISAFSLGAPFLIYEYWFIQIDPVLAAWSRQNLTPAPALVDFLLSLSPALILAGVGVAAGWKGRRTAEWAMLAGWVIAGVILVYLPVGIQRRFMTGLYVPVALLAVSGVHWLQSRSGKKGGLYPALIGLSVLTNVFFMTLVFSGPLLAVGVGDRPASGDQIYIPRTVMDSLVWMRGHTPAGSVVLADTDTGLWVPAWGGRRTVYGHPFETPNAEQIRAEVDRFYSGALDAKERSDFLNRNGVDFILLRTGEQDEMGRVRYDQGGVRIVEVNP